MKEVMIELRDISKTYPDGKLALHDVTLSLGNEVVGLLGPNGAGKTTLMSILVLARAPTRGSRRYFDGVTESRARCRIGYLPQEFIPIADLTVLEYLMHCAAMRGVPLDKARSRANRLLEIVQLQDASRRRLGACSGGMVRRAGLAQALIHGPAFLVVDEPTTGLDPEERIRFRSIVGELSGRMPVLLSSHLVEDVAATCARIVIVARGQVRFDGPKQTLIDRFQDALWQLPEGSELPEGAVSLGLRTTSSGSIVQRFLAPGTQPEPTSRVESNLEDAYAALLARERADDSGGVS